MKKGRIVSWNVNGIRAVSKKGFSDWLQKEQPDILGVQETKANLDQAPKEIQEPKGYHVYWNGAERKGYSGTAVFTKHKPLSVQNGIGIEKFDCEGRVIQLEFPDFYYLNIYFPNGGDENKRVPFKLEFYDAVLKHCEKLRKKKGVIVSGDYNTAHTEIDLKNPKSNKKNTGFLPEERAWIDKYISKGYIDVFRNFNTDPGQYSYWSYRFNARAKNVGWRIDYHMVSEEIVPNVKKATILNKVMGSDHCPVEIEVKF